MRSGLILLLLALAPLHAHEFDAAEYFGAHLRAAESDTLRIELSLAGAHPAFLDLHTSGAGDVATRFRHGTTGVEVNPDGDHRSCELALDFGVTEADSSVLIAELDKGATVAFHLRPLDAASGSALLAELSRGRESGFTLRVRVFDQGRFKQMPGVVARADVLEFPLALKLRITEEALVLAAGALQLETPVQLAGGALIGIAVTDARARLRDWHTQGKPSAAWQADAAARQYARRALARLREISTQGMIAGVAAQPWPALQDDLAAYPEAQREQRERALALPPAARADAMAEIARALPDNAMANHEAGIAALQAGDVDAARAQLMRALSVRATHAGRLALAESERRLGNLDSAAALLTETRRDLPDALAPEHALISARLLAARGKIAEAAAALDAAAQAHPGHAILQDFRHSAHSLAALKGLQAQQGPLGLQLLTDMGEPAVAQLRRRLAPYLDAIRYWLPRKVDLTGTIVVYKGPVEYLNAAMLVAGDNQDNVAGMFLRTGIRGLPTILACRAFGEAELVRTLVHELWHLALACATEGPLPPWLDEGMAVYLSAARVQDGVLRYDTLPAEFAGDAPALDTAATARVLAAGGLTFYRPAEIRANYRAAWALVWGLAVTPGGDDQLKLMLAGDAEALKGLKAQLPALAAKVNTKLETIRREP